MKTIEQRYEDTDVARLRQHPRNPRRGNVAAITDSIAVNGFYGAIVAQRSSGHVLAGNHRLQAAIASGASVVPVVWIDVDDDRALRILLVDNKSSDDSVNDEDALASLLADLAASDDGLIGTGYTLIDDANDADDDAPEKPEVAASTHGDLWIMGRHRLVCGDSSDPRIIELAAPDGWQVVVLDPPYELGDAVWSRWIQDPSIVFGQGRQITLIPRRLWRFERVIIKAPGTQHRSATVQVRHSHAWVVQCGSNKRLPADKKATMSSVIQQEKELRHDHQKPVDVLVDHLTHWTPTWETVIDPFAGSGSTVIAAERMGRSAAAIELDPGFCDVIVQRWENETGQKAKNIRISNT